MLNEEPWQSWLQPSHNRRGARVIAGLLVTFLLLLTVYIIPFVAELPEAVSIQAPGFTCERFVSIARGETTNDVMQALGVPLERRAFPGERREAWIYATPRSWYLLGGLEAVIGFVENRVVSLELQSFDETVVFDNGELVIDRTPTVVMCAGAFPRAR